MNTIPLFVYCLFQVNDSLTNTDTVCLAAPYRSIQRDNAGRRLYVSLRSAPCMLKYGSFTLFIGNVFGQTIPQFAVIRVSLPVRQKKSPVIIGIQINTSASAVRTRYVRPIHMQRFAFLQVMFDRYPAAVNGHGIYLSFCGQVHFLCL